MLRPSEYVIYINTIKQNVQISTHLPLANDSRDKKLHKKLKKGDEFACFLDTRFFSFQIYCKEENVL